MTRFTPARSRRACGIPQKIREVRRPVGACALAEGREDRGRSGPGEDGTRPIEFIRDLDELAMLVDQFTKLQPDFRRPDHPIFGRMSHSATTCA